MGQNSTKNTCCFNLFLKSMIPELLSFHSHKWNQPPCFVDARWLTHTRWNVYIQVRKFMAVPAASISFIGKVILKRHQQVPPYVFLVRISCACFGAGDREHILGVCLKMHWIYGLLWKINVYVLGLFTYFDQILYFPMCKTVQNSCTFY